MAGNNPFSDPSYGLEPGESQAINPFGDPEYGKEDAGQGVGGTLWQGTKSAGRAIGATVDAYTGDNLGIVDKAKAQQEAPKDARLDKFYSDFGERTDALGEDPGVLETIGEAAGAVWDNPAGAGLAVVEQLPNAAPALAGGFAGMKAGAAGGAALGSVVPGLGTAAGGAIGGVVGGLAGMFIGNTAIETGHKAMGLADDGVVTDEERSQAISEGAIKGGVITGVDALTLGVGGKVANTLQRTTSTAMESATRKALIDRGVDVADNAAVLAARSNPEIASAVRAAQESARQATDKLGKRMTVGGTLLGMETVGEGVGEYLGELAATGEGNVPDAVLESILSLGQSGVETAFNMARKSPAKDMWIQPAPSAENPTPAPVPRPDPNAGALSRAAALLPAPSIAGRLPAPDTLYADSQGNVNSTGPVRNVDGTLQPDSQASPPWVNPGNAPSTGGAGMDQQTERGAQPGREGDFISASRFAGQQVRAGETIDGQLAPQPAGLLAPQRRLADGRPNAGFIETNAAGESRQAKAGNVPPKDYVPQGGRGMDQQTPVGKRYSNALQAKNAIQKAGVAATHEAVQVAPKQFEVRAKPVPKQRIVNRDRDSLTQAITRLGGIKTNYRQDTTGDTKGNKFLPGVGALWSDNTGTSLDDMASLLDQNGYVPAGEMNRDGGVSWLQSALGDELAGRRTTYAPGAARQEAELLKQEAERNAAQLESLPGDVLEAKLDAVFDLTEEVKALEARRLEHEQRVAELDKLFGDTDASEEQAAGSRQPDRNADEVQGSADQGSGLAGSRDTDQGSRTDAPRDTPAEALELTQQTEAELADLDRQQKERDKAAAEVTRKADEQARKAADAAFAKQQNEAANAEFTLGGDAEQNLTGQRGMFDAPSASQAKPATPISIEGADIDGDWALFSKGSGTLGIARADMPQIKAEHRGAMVNFLNARDIAHQEETVPAGKLKPTQAEYSRKKVEKAKAFDGGDRSILISKDGHVLDGHHQWLARRDAGEDVKVIRLDAPIKKLLGEVAEFPSATQDDASSTVPAADQAKPAAKQASKKPAEKIEDAGEQLTYNRKNMFRSGGLKWDDIATENEALKIKLAGKEKIWARPNWEQIIEAQPEGQRDGFRMVAHLVKQAYDGLPKQSTSKTDEGLQRYIAAVTELRDAAETLLGDRAQVEAVITAVAVKAQRRMSRSFSIADATANDVRGDDMPLFKALFPAQAAGARFERGTPANDKGAAIGNKAIKAMQWNADSAVDAMKAIEAGWPAKQEAWQKRGYAVFHNAAGEVKARHYESKNAEEPQAWASLQLAGRNIEQVAGEFTTKESAETAANARIKALDGQYLVLDKRKQLLGSFADEEAAIDFARSQTARKQDDSAVEDDADQDWDARTGEQRRPGGQNISADDLKEAFGFRGVSFGNWVKQGERQQHLNAAYDAFADLADVMGLPPKAMSLNGMLGVAFGAQGSGKFAAHFIPGVNEINITKTRGAGSLAHEWAHGLDHYFGVQAGLGREENPFASVLGQHRRDKAEREIRPEIAQAFKDLVLLMRTRNEDPADVVRRRQEALTNAKVRVGAEADRLRPRVAGNTEALAALDAAVAGDVGEYVDLPIPKGKRKPIGAIPKNIKTVFDALGYSSQEANDQAHRLQSVFFASEELKREVTTRAVHSQFYKNSAALEGKSSKPYWATQWEMFARAFESWVMDALAEKGRANNYLVRSSKKDQGDGSTAPYPAGAERELINQAFAKLAADINHRQPDDAGNIALYRLSDTQAKGIPLFSARAIANKISKTTGLKVETVANEAGLPDAVQAQIKRDGVSGRVAGVYHGGTSYLIASNLRDTKHAMSIVLHEAVGHGGVKAVLGARLDKVMQDIYRDMPADMKRDLEQRYAGQTASLSTAEAQTLIAEEYVAHLAESDPQNGIIARLVAMLRQFIRDTFGDAAALKWTRGDLVQLLAEARQSAASTGNDSASRYSAAEEVPLPEVSEVSEAEFVASLAGANGAFAKAMYKARGTDSPFFKGWFGKSRMVDKQGRPIAFVHRSYGERNTFNDASLGGNSGTPTAALGHFLARKDVGNVERYGPVTEQFYIRMNKPKVVTQDQFEAMGDWSLLKVKAYRKTLMEQGHDGLYIQGLAWPVVFEGKNIKAARNAGTFDESSNVRYSLADDARALFDRTVGPAPLERNDPFAAENRRLREGEQTLWQKAKKQFARQFAPGGLLPDSVFAEKITRDSEFQAVEFDVRHLSGGLNKAVKADFGVDLDNLTAEQMKPLAEALAGKVDPAIPEATRVAIVAMRQYIDSLSGEYLSIIQGQIDAHQEKSATYGPALKVANDARKALTAAIASSSDPAITQAAAAKKAALAAQVKAKKAMNGLRGDERATAKTAYEAAVKVHDKARSALRAALSPTLKVQLKEVDALRATANEARSSTAEAKAEAALYEKITGNLGAYVNRSYQAFDDPKWFKTVPTEVVNTARAYLAAGYMEQGETAAEAARLADVTVNEMLKNGTAYDSMGGFIAESKLGAKDLTVLIKRKDIAPEIRALLGEYMDPRLNFAKSATKMGRMVWNQRFLDRVLEFGMGTLFFEGKNRPADATTQIAGEQSESYAPLNGLWTFPEVAQSFQDALGKEQMSDLYRTVVRLNGMVKYGKTILSPTTAMRNWQSAMFFSLANGHFDLTQMKKSWAALREQVTQNATGEDLTYLRKLKQLGVVYDTPYAGEMMALMNDARMDELLSSKSGTGLKWLRKANQFAQGFYSFGDDFWKIIGYENEKASLIAAGIPEAEAETMAAERIRNTYPTYSMIGKAVQWLRRFPLAGTFVSFPSEIIRTTVGMMQLVNADLKSDNPKIRALGRKRAAGMAMVSAGFYALSAMTAAALGVGDDEEEALRDLAAPWSKNSTFLYTGRDADGKLRYFDMSFLDPYGYWKRPLTAMLRDQPWEDAAASGISDMLSPFFGADITAGAIFEVLANKKPTGSQVYNENAGSVDQLQDISNHMRKALQPGFVSNAERLWLAGSEARREGSGQPYDMRDEVVSLLGWRAATLDTQTGLYYRSFDFTDALSDARKTLTRTLRSSNSVSEGDIRESKQAATAQYQKAFTEMGRLVSSAGTAGMSRSEIMQTLKLSGVAQRNIFALMSGRVPPIDIGMQAQAKAVQQARVMRDNEHAVEIARRFRLAREQ